MSTYRLIVHEWNNSSIARRLNQKTDLNISSTRWRYIEASPYCKSQRWNRVDWTMAADDSWEYTHTMQTFLWTIQNMTAVHIHIFIGKHEWTSELELHWQKLASRTDARSLTWRCLCREFQIRRICIALSICFSDPTPPQWGSNHSVTLHVGGYHPF